MTAIVYCTRKRLLLHLFIHDGSYSRSYGGPPWESIWSPNV